MCALVGAGRVEGKKRKEIYTVSARSCTMCFLDKISFNPHSNSIIYTLSSLYRLGNREINYITNRGGTLTSKLLGVFFFTVASCILMYGWEDWQLPQGLNEQQEKLRWSKYCNVYYAKDNYILDSLGMNSIGREAQGSEHPNCIFPSCTRCRLYKATNQGLLPSCFYTSNL